MSRLKTIKKLWWLYIITFIMISGCATYYMKTIKVQESILRGDMARADKLMVENKKDEKGKNAILHYLNHGYITYMLQDYNRSNQYFQTADRLIEDQQKNYALDALTYLTNPMIKPYKPEDFEPVMLNFFTSFNYINMGKYDESLVETKRINIKLQKLNDKYPDNKNKYQRDAFAHVLMGLVYDANKEYNDAFIAYRNAWEIYESDYKKNFNVSTPEQLKRDIIRTAYLTGFYDEVDAFQRKFGIQYDPKQEPESNLVFIWMNGFGPIKDEWSINFTKVPGGAGNVTFVNEEMGLSFNYFTGDMNSNEKAAFSDLRFLRIAFPKYTERKPYFVSASLTNGQFTSQLEMAENINDIAFKTLNDRLVREMAKSLLRLATKKALEEVANRQNQNLGTIVGIINAVTEKADTRNWQTLPYSFSYSRLPLNTGTNNYKLNTAAANGDRKSFDFTVEAEKGKTYFKVFHNIESYPPAGQ